MSEHIQFTHDTLAFEARDWPTRGMAWSYRISPWELLIDIFSPDLFSFSATT